jgi:predicted nucleic acid-binding protein
MLAIADASVIIDALLGVQRALIHLLRYDVQAPVTVDAEVLHALRRKWVAKSIDATEAAVAVAAFRRFPITRHPVQPLVDRMWALRDNITAYDAAYVALAESLNAPLLTRDRRLSRASAHAARIEYIA